VSFSATSVMNRGDRREPIFRDHADRQRFVETMLAQKQSRKLLGERAYRNRPLSDEQKESNRQKSKIRARIEHVFGYMSQSMKGFYLR
jgi:IS5 family transposase